MQRCVLRATILFITRSDGPVRRLLIGLRPPFRRNFRGEEKRIEPTETSGPWPVQIDGQTTLSLFFTPNMSRPKRIPHRVDSTRLCRPSGEQNWSLHQAKSGQFFKKKKVVLIALITKFKALGVVCLSSFFGKKGMDGLRSINPVLTSATTRTSHPPLTQSRDNGDDMFTQQKANF